MKKKEKLETIRFNPVTKKTDLIKTTRIHQYILDRQLANLKKTKNFR